ncbi:MAG: glycosyltransferase [Chloroflexi bacterium]|nr:glycosyltransferase [Chloroflexota bacterium]
MKILFVAPYVPNLVRVRPYNFIRSLSNRGHQVTLLTPWTNEQDQADIEHLQPICHHIISAHISQLRSLWNCVQVIPTHKPFQSVFSWLPALTSLVNPADYDVVHVEHLRGSRYGLHFKTHTTLPVVWDSVDCITHLFDQAVTQSADFVRRWRSRMDLARTAKYEAWAVNQFNQVLVTSKVDKGELLHLSHTPDAPISVVPNGVDLDYFKPDTAVTRQLTTLIVSGKMSYHANIAMVRHLVHNIMPLVWQQRADINLWIVGKDPISEIRSLSAHPHITVTGTVPDLPPYINQAAIAVAPITYNAGIQNKILEAMACGTPVVTTPQAISALDLVPGKDLLVADGPKAYAQAILELLANPQKSAQVGVNGRRYVEINHNWGHIAQQLETIYRQSISAQTAVNNGRQSPIAPLNEQLIQEATN